MSRKGSMEKLLDRVAHDEAPPSLQLEATDFFARARDLSDASTVFEKYAAQRALVQAARHLIGAAREVSKGMKGRVRPSRAAQSESPDR